MNAAPRPRLTEIAAALRLRVQPKAGGGTLRLGYTF